MKIFIFSSRFPYPIERGDKLRLYNQIKGLSKDHEIYLFTLDSEDTSQESLDELYQYCTSIKTFKIPIVLRWFEIIKSFFSQLPFQVVYHYNKSFQQVILEDIKTIKPDIVYCQLIRMAAYASTINVPKVLDYMDAYGIGMERRSKISKWYLKWLYRIEASRTKRYEKSVYHDFDKHTIISNQDASLIKVSPIEVIANGLDYDYFKPISVQPKYTLGFVGNMGYLPNVEAAEILCREIIPKLTGKLKSDVSLLIAGARPHDRVKRLQSDQIIVSGWVEDIRIAYAECALLVAPLFHGTGQQNKILEAMAMNVPCITTSAVNKAIGAIPNEQILIADNIDEFVDKIKLILSDEQLYQKIKTNSREFIIREFGWEQTNKKLNAIFVALAETKNAELS